MSRTLGALLSLAAAGCAGDLEDPERFADGPYCNLDLDVPRLFADRCGTSACHTSDVAAGGLDLVSDGLEERLVGAPAHTCPGRQRVVPGDEDAGFLLEKIEGVPECGLPMPFLGRSLGSRELACVREWLREISAQ